MASTEPMDDAASARSLVPLLPALEVTSKAQHHSIFHRGRLRDPKARLLAAVGGNFELRPVIRTLRGCRIVVSWKSIRRRGVMSAKLLRGLMVERVLLNPRGLKMDVGALRQSLRR